MIIYNIYFKWYAISMSILKSFLISSLDSKVDFHDLELIFICFLS